MKPTATKQGKPNPQTMANIGQRCTIDISEGCSPEQNRPPNLILTSASAVNPAITDVFGLKVEHRLTLAAFYPVITVFYRVITGFLTFCSDRGKFGLTAPLLGPNYRYRDLPEITGGTYRVC